VKIPSKVDLVIWIAIALCAAGVIFTINKWRLDSAKLKVTEKALVDEKAGRARDAEQYAKNQAKTEKHGNEFDTAIEQKRDERGDTPIRPVRLCKPAAVVPATGDAAVADHAQGGTELQEEARRDPEVGRDIGPELYGEADRADEVAIQLNACIDWINDRG
jgi:hypothetical protein